MSIRDGFSLETTLMRTKFVFFTLCCGENGEKVKNGENGENDLTLFQSISMTFALLYVIKLAHFHNWSQRYILIRPAFLSRT